MTEERTENDALIEAARAGASASELDDGLWAVPTGAGDVRVVDIHKEREWMLVAPRRKTGRRVVGDAESLVAYLARHSGNETEVWADLEAKRVVAFIDGHGVENGGFHEHSATLLVQYTPEWQAWKEASGALMSQTQFADFIEQRAVDVQPRLDDDGSSLYGDPTALDLLEIAHTITGHRNVQFKSGVRTDNGAVSIGWVEDVKGGAGQTGDTEIPTHLALAIRPFVGGDRFLVEASLRWRVTEQGVILGWTLINPDGVIETAFDDYLDQIRTGLVEIEGGTGYRIPLYQGKVTA